MREKRHILICSNTLYKCTLGIHPPQDPTVGKHAMIPVPSLRRNHVFPQGSLENDHHQVPTLTMNRANFFIIWNIQGGNNDDFIRKFRYMFATHHQCMVTLLKNRMTNHVTLMNEFDFTYMIEVPAEGQSGGMVVM